MLKEKNSICCSNGGRHREKKCSMLVDAVTKSKYLLNRLIKLAAIEMGSLRDFDRAVSLIDRLYLIFGTDNKR